MPVAPIPSASALEHATSKPPPSKPAGAYRPPGARGLAAPSIFKREDEGGRPHRSSGGMSTPPRGYNRSPIPGGHPSSNGDQNGKGARNGRRPHVPGAPTSPPPGDGDKRGKQKKKKKDGKEAENGDTQVPPQIEESVNGSSSQPAPPMDGTIPSTPATEIGSLDPIAKKIRNLSKKVWNAYSYEACCPS